MDLHQESARRSVLPAIARRFCRGRGLMPILRRVAFWNKRVGPFCICFTVYAWMNVTGLRGTLRISPERSESAKRMHWQGCTLLGGLRTHPCRRIYINPAVVSIAGYGLRQTLPLYGVLWQIIGFLKRCSDRIAQLLKKVYCGIDGVTMISIAGDRPSTVEMKTKRGQTPLGAIEPQYSIGKCDYS